MKGYLCFSLWNSGFQTFIGLVHLLVAALLFYSLLSFIMTLKRRIPLPVFEI